VQSFEPKRTCVICNSNESRFLYRQSFSVLSDGSSLLSTYDVVVCSKCGFCFADRIPQQTVFDKYYRDMSKYEKTDRGGQDTLYENLRFQKLARIISGFLQSQETFIFEIGCANGQLLALLKDEGYKNVSGIDPSPVSAETAHRKYDINVTANTLSDVKLNDGSVDFLLLVGVLEHVQDLISALHTLRKMLTANGKIFISVPDASRYVDGEDAPYQEFSLEHINFFGPTSLTNLMIGNGFRLVSSQQDIIESNFRTSTPVIHGVYEKCEDSMPVSYPIDTITEAGLIRYIQQSDQVDIQIQAAIDKLVSDGNPIIVWGTGAHTLRLLATSKLGQANIRAYVDSNPRYQGKELNGMPIVSPHEIMEWPEPILISSRVYQEEIAGEIVSDLHMKNEIIRLYSYDRR
jgi:SAM-dependent methyltransferase